MAKRSQGAGADGGLLEIASERDPIEQQYLDLVEEAVLAGAELRDIRTLVAKKCPEWQPDDFALNACVDACLAKIHGATHSRDDAKAESIARLRRLYTKLTLIQDYKGALSVQKELNKLLLTEAPKPAATSQGDHARRVSEWKPYRFAGSPKQVRRKHDLLAHLEDAFTIPEACRRAGVLRWEFKSWVREEDDFAGCVEEAYEVCVQRVESNMYRAATIPDSDGNIDRTAAFGILNSKTEDWGLLKAQLMARQNAKLLDSITAALLAELPAESALKIRAILDRFVDRSRRLPSGASLK